MYAHTLLLTRSRRQARPAVEEAGEKSVKIDSLPLTYYYFFGWRNCVTFSYIVLLRKVVFFSSAAGMFLYVYFFPIAQFFFFHFVSFSFFSLSLIVTLKYCCDEEREKENRDKLSWIFLYHRLIFRARFFQHFYYLSFRNINKYA